MFRDWGKNDSLLPKYIYICILAASVKLFALCWPCEATTFISASRPSRAGFGCLQTCAMGQFSTSFHESCDLHRHSSLKNNSLTAKPNLLCCSLSPLLLVLFTVHMKNILFPSGTAIYVSEDSYQVLFEFSLAQRHK